MKTCTKCKQVKPLDQFNRHKYTPGGFHRRCKPCTSEDRAPRRERERKAQMAKYYENHQENILKQRKYQSENRDKYRNASKKWREQNPLMMRVLKDIWDSENKHKNAAAANRYYTRKRERCPKWLTSEQHAEIEKYYFVARWLTDQSGIKHAVDHIVPLHGENVCGLHVPWNLQVLTLSENSAKGNCFE